MKGLALLDPLNWPAAKQAVGDAHDTP